MSTLDFIMRQPIVYRLWMAPFAKTKFAPIVARNNMSRVRRVLDVGCGPGTNANYFSDVARSQVGVARAWPRIVRIVSLTILGLALAAVILWFTLR